FVAISSLTATNLKTLIPHRTHDILVRPCSVIDKPPVLSRQYSQANEPIRLMYAGRIQNQQKRIYDLLILARILKQRQLSFCLDFFGGGSEKDWLQKQFEKMILPGDFATVRFYDCVPHEDMMLHWRNSDICVLVSDFEGTSISMLEAMSCGCIPIVTKVSGTKAVIREGINGFTVPIGAMEVMADKIEALMQDRLKLQQTGQAAYDSVADRFSFDSYLEWFDQIRREIWQKSPRQWSLGRTILPDRFQPPPPPTLLQRVKNKIARKVYQTTLALKIQGILTS
ncbi:MAG: glycosyltransferase, partial [Cyanobacteria bacterium J06642_11]